VTDNIALPTGPPRRDRPPWGALAIFVVGSVLVAGAAAVAMALVMALLCWQLMANVVMVAFVQELRWYGPGVYTAGGDLWWYVTGVGIGGFAVMGLGVWWITAAGATMPQPWRRRRAC
jgi:hypothetical protein